MKTLSLAAAFGTALLAGCASGTYVSNDAQTRFQNGTATQAQIESELGAPSSTASLVGGGKRDVYTYHSGYSDPVDYVPLLALAAGTRWPTTRTVNFDFNAQGVLVASQSRTTRG